MTLNYVDYKNEKLKKVNGGLKIFHGDNYRRVILTHNKTLANELIKKNIGYTIILKENDSQINMINALIIKFMIEEIIIVEKTLEKATLYIKKEYDKYFCITNCANIPLENSAKIIEFKLNFPIKGVVKALDIKSNKVSLNILQNRILESYFFTIRGSKENYGLEELAKSVYIRSEIYPKTEFKNYKHTKDMFFLNQGVKMLVEAKLREIINYDQTIEESIIDRFSKIKSSYMKYKDKPAELLNKKNIKSNDEYIGEGKFYTADNPYLLADYLAKKNSVENKPLKNIGNALYAFEENKWKGYTSDEFITEIQYTFKDEGNYFYKPRLYTAIREILSYRKELQEDAGYFQRERNTLLIPFKNGLYDPKENELIPHSPENSLNYVLDIEFGVNKDYTTPTRWLQALNEWGQSEETITFLQEFIGQMFSSYLHGDSKFLFLVGPGSNGKSVFIDVLEHLVSDINSVRMSIDQMAKPEYLIQLKDKIAVFSSEGSMKYLKKSKAIKNAVHGEKLSVADKYEKAVSFRPFATYIFATNHDPLNADKSQGWLRRFETLQFNNIFTDKEKDRTLIPKLLEEKESIVAWAMEGYKRYVENGFVFTNSKQLKENKLDYEKTNNPVFDFFTETFVVTKDKKDMISADIVYDLFLEYKKESGQEKIYKKKNSLTKEIRSLIKTKEFFDSGDTRLWGKDQYSNVCNQHGTLNCIICKSKEDPSLWSTKRGITMLEGIKIKEVIDFERQVSELNANKIDIKI